MKDALPVFGRVTATLYAADGRIKARHVGRNLVVTTGRQWIAGRLLMVDDLPLAASHIGVGTDSTAAALNQTALVTPLGDRRALVTAVQNANSVVYTTTFPPGFSTGAITEYGLFNAATDGTMIARAVKTVINKEAGDSLAVVWTLTLGA